MFDLDKWQEIFNTISKHKLRTFLTMLGVFWGIFMLVFLMGAGKGLENGVTGLFGSHAKNSMYVWTNATSKPYKGFDAGRRFNITNEDIVAIRQNFGDKIQYIAPRLWMPSGEITYKDKKGAYEVRGDTPDLLQIDAIAMTDGRFLNQLDLEERRKVAVIGRHVKKALFGEEGDPVGEYIRILGADYMVIGVAKSDRRGQDGMEDDKTIFVPLTTAQQARNRPGQVGWFVCSMYPDVSVSQMEAPLLALLKQRHSVAPDDPKGFGRDNVEEEFREISGLFTGIRLLSWFVGIGSLLAGVIGVSNIMLIVVRERTKEIGIRKAIGATPGSIVSLIMMESIFLTSLAGYAGLATSVGLISLLNVAVGEGSEFYANPEVDMRVGLVAFFILVVAGALAGLIPALQASNVNPVVALKDE
ncbi:MAG: ABC transporter permease [Bacteroidota bacterium]